MEECLIPLVFNGRHILLNTFRQLVKYTLSSNYPFFFKIWILKKCMYDTTVYSFTKMRKIQDFCFEKSLYLAYCDGHHWSHMIFDKCAYQVSEKFWMSELKIYIRNINWEKRGDMLTKSSITFFYNFSSQLICMCTSYKIHISLIVWKKHHHLVFLCMINTFVNCYQWSLVCVGNIKVYYSRFIDTS